MSASRKKGLLVLTAGIVIAVLSFIVPSKDDVTEDGNYLKRNEFGEGDAEVSLVVSTPVGDIPLTYNVNERIYTEEELLVMLPEFTAHLEQVVLGENESRESVNKDLDFTDSIEGYPFIITWSSDRGELVGTQGNIKEEIHKEELIMLTAEFEYENYVYEHSFPIVLVPPVLTAKEEETNKLKESLKAADMQSKTESYITLPSVINGDKVQWSKKRENKGIKIAGICVAIAILLFSSEAIEKKESSKKRLAEIKEDYPEFALKCSMLIGAGMTMRQTFEKIAKSYVANSMHKRALYEEITVGLRELESGVPERQVYERFGRRCGIRETEKFGNLMSRNLRKGSEGLKNALRQEAREAMDMHKEQIRRKGETAGTKLLFPMLILLLIVMVIIMVPAFSTFNI